MKHCFKLFVCLVSLSGAALAATEVQPESSSAPVAFVYVTRPTHVDGFAVASNGKLTPVPGSPFANISVYHLSSTKKFLFGAGDDQKHIYTFAIASNGSIKQVASTNTGAYVPAGYSTGPIQIDFTGSTLYYYLLNRGTGSFVQEYKIESNGELQYIGMTETDDNFDIHETTPTMVSFLGTNQFAYQTGCVTNTLEPATVAFKRESDGVLVLGPQATPLPKTQNSEDVYCPYSVASDPGNHLAFEYMEWNVKTKTPLSSGGVLASYTADSKGNLTTTATYENMPETGAGFANTLSISPTGKLLAVGGDGFQIFHFNGSSPITHHSGLLQTNHQFQEFGWDSSNHLFALSTGHLFVYTVTPTSVVQATGSSYSIPEATSLIVHSVN